MPWPEEPPRSPPSVLPTCRRRGHGQSTFATNPTPAHAATADEPTLGACLDRGHARQESYASWVCLRNEKRDITISMTDVPCNRGDRIRTCDFLVPNQAL